MAWLNFGVGNILQKASTQRWTSAGVREGTSCSFHSNHSEEPA